MTAKDKYDEFAARMKTAVYYSTHLHPMVELVIYITLSWLHPLLWAVDHGAETAFLKMLE